MIENMLLVKKLGDAQETLKGQPPYDVRTLSFSYGEITALLKALIAVDAMRAAIGNPR